MELEWVSKITGSESSLKDLQSGVVLCKLINKLEPGSAKYTESKMPFKQRENIVHFLDAAKSAGVLDHELFTTEDLFDLKNVDMVYTTLRALSRVLHAKDESIELIGPPVATRPKRMTHRDDGWIGRSGRGLNGL